MLSDRESSFRHEALFHSGEDEFLAGTLPFVREAVAGDEPVLIAVGESKLPAITDTDPDSPANDRNPEVKGTVGGGNPTQVRLYTNPTCSGAPAATGTVARFTGAGITVRVAADATTNLSAPGRRRGGKPVRLLELDHLCGTALAALCAAGQGDDAGL